MRKVYSKNRYEVFVLYQDSKGSQVQPKTDKKFKLCEVREISKNVRRQITQLQGYLYCTYLRLRYGCAETFLGLVWDNRKLVHVSWVIPAKICNTRYSFIPKGRYVIGPSSTSPDYRGQHIFPYVLQQVVSCLPKCQEFWIFANEENTPSLRGIKKAGGQKIGTFIHIRLLWGLFSRVKYFAEETATS